MTKTVHLINGAFSRLGAGIVTRCGLRNRLDIESTDNVHKATCKRCLQGNTAYMNRQARKAEREKRNAEN